MKPAPFDYERPTSVDAVLSFLASRNGAKIIAGGQSLVPMMNFRVARPDVLVDINRIPGLNYCKIEGAELVIGALCRHAMLASSPLVAEACPLMHEAYQWVAHGPVRNRGTLCGNLCHADPASEMLAVTQALDAVMVLRSKAGERRFPASDFFQGIFDRRSRRRNAGGSQNSLAAEGPGLGLSRGLRPQGRLRHRRGSSDVADCQRARLTRRARIMRDRPSRHAHGIGRAQPGGQIPG